jgi:hypothetical protein
MDAPDFAFTLARELDVILADRKVGSLSDLVGERSPISNFRQVEHQVVERAAKIKQTLADQDRNLLWWRNGQLDFDYIASQLAAIRVEIVGDDIGILQGPILDLIIEGRQMLIRTL